MRGQWVCFSADTKINNMTVIHVLIIAAVRHTAVQGMALG